MAKSHSFAVTGPSRLNNLVSTGAGAANTITNAALNTGQGIAGTDTSEGNQLSNIYGNQSSGMSNALNSAGANVDYYGTKNNLFGSGSSGGSFTGGGFTGSTSNLAGDFGGSLA